MATSRSFNAMLNEFLAYDLLMAEQEKRNWFISKVEKDNSWKGGNGPTNAGLVVPFKGSSASSFRYGKLTAESDISENEYVRGKVDNYKEIWGTMMWHAKDLVEHDGKVSESSFLKGLPNMIEEFSEDMKGIVSVGLLTGAHHAKAIAGTATYGTALGGTATGYITVDRIERFHLKQKVGIKDDNTAVVSGYIREIDIDENTIRVGTARTGGFVAVNLSTYLVADNAKVYVDGADDSANAFTSLKSQLLSAANGGSAQLFGQTKLAYPYLQCPNISGAGFSASFITDQVFEAWTRYKQLGKGSADEIICSYKHLGNIMRNLETGSGAYKNVETKVNLYGYTEITLTGVKGALKFVGVHEMDDDVMFLMDWKAVKLFSNGFFRKQTTPEGLAYYTVRTEDGYKYICDISFFGELVCHKPTACGIIHGITY